MRTFLLTLLLAATTTFAQDAPSLSGRVTDETGGVLAGATVEVTNTAGLKKTATTDKNGQYKVQNLPPGTYIVSVEKLHFSPFANGAVEVQAGRENVMDAQLNLSLAENVTVQGETDALSTDPNATAGTIVLKGSDIEALPDDPDELAEYLQALAGPAAGPNGGQMYVDGFAGTLPPKSSIREIRVGGNPFSAEYDRMGFGGRIEILTRAGTDKMRGDVSFNFNDDLLNARNHYAQTRPPYQRRDWRGSLSGPLVAKKVSFSINAEHSSSDENDIINATVLNPSLEIVPFNDVLVAGSGRTEINPRLDFALNPNHTLVARYEYSQNDRANSGVGNFNLSSRAFDTSGSEHLVQLTETAVLHGKIINEVRVQFTRQDQSRDGDNRIPSVNVPEAFNGGGAQVGHASSREKGWEIGNTTSWTMNKHAFRVGGRARGTNVDDISPNNFGGSITFSGGDLAPLLDENNQVIRDAQGQLVLGNITNIERYRRTLLFTQMGLSPAEIRLRGGGPTQYRVNGGNPEAAVDQWDFGLFGQDDWRMSQNLTLSMGLRYENQTNISSPLNVAPRAGFAWAVPSKVKNAQPTLVIRGGAGIFYDRFGQSLTLDAERANGVNQQQYVVTNPLILDQMHFTYDSITGVPSAETLTDFSVPQATRVVAEDVDAPYRLQGGVSIERALPKGVRGTVSLIGALGRHELRSRNINAPLPSGVRPLGTNATVYQYESTGRSSQKQVIVGFNRAGRKLSVFANYSLTFAYSDTDGAGTFPANQYDLSDEWGRASYTGRHSAFIGGNVQAPWGVRVSGFMTVGSGAPFNIYTGRDNNNDTVLNTDRPAFATDPNKPGVVSTRWGLLDPNPEPGQKIIPRNFGTGPGRFSMTMNLTKTIGFGKSTAAPTPPGGAPDGGGFGGRGPGVGGGARGEGGGGGGNRGFGGRFGGDAGNHRYNLSISLRAINVLNHTNPGPPIGNLSSPHFGESTSTGGFGGFGGGGFGLSGPRRIMLSMGLRF
jgi:hypothetical protein